MSADQIAEIAPAIREALAGGPDWSAMLQMAGTPAIWVQFTDGLVNAAYPFSNSPDEILSRLGGCSLEGWEAQKYITVRLEFDQVRAIAKWIDQYFEKALGAPPGYAIDVTLERLQA